MTFSMHPVSLLLRTVQSKHLLSSGTSYLGPLPSRVVELTQTLKPDAAWLLGFNGVVGRTSRLTLSTHTRFGGRQFIRQAALIEQLLCRFLVSLWGGSVFLFFARNLQRRLRLAELAFIYLQGQRIFARMPASIFQVRQQEMYPWRYGATALYIAVMLRDPSLLVR